MTNPIFLQGNNATIQVAEWLSLQQTETLNGDDSGFDKDGLNQMTVEDLPTIGNGSNEDGQKPLDKNEKMGNFDAPEDNKAAWKNLGIIQLVFSLLKLQLIHNLLQFQ